MSDPTGAAAALAVGPATVGAPVHDADGYRLGFVEAVDLRGEGLTVIEAGFGLGVLAGTYEVPGPWIRQASPARVDLAVPARVLRQQGEARSDAPRPAGQAGFRLKPEDRLPPT